MPFSAAISRRRRIRRKVRGRRAFTLLALSALAACTRPSVDLVIENVSVYSGEDPVPFVATVAVEGGRIQSLTPPGERAPRGRETVDGQGQYLIPGLWDAHVHLRSSEDGGLDLESFAAFGITSVRDLGGYPERLDEALANSANAPTVYAARDMLNGESFAGFQTVVSTPRDVAREIERLASEGAAFVKVHRALDPDLLSVVVREAHARGLKVTGHIPLGMHPLMACQAGMDGVEHVGSLVEALASVLPEGSNSNEDALRYLLSDATNRIYNCFSANEIYVTPSLTIYPAIARRRSGSDDIPPEFEDTIVALGQVTKKLYDAGVPLLAGTDTTDRTESFELEPGRALHEELALLEAAGIASASVVGMATANPARFLDVYDVTGSITPGKVADLVLLNRDPATGVAAVSSIAAVYRDGALIHRNDP